MIYKECYDHDNFTIEIYTPDSPVKIIYLFGLLEETDLPYDLLDETAAAAVVITGTDAAHFLPVLSEEAAGKEQNADRFLGLLFNEIIPQAEDILSDVVDCPPSFHGLRRIAGIGTASVFPLYSLYRTDLFRHAVLIDPDLSCADLQAFLDTYKIYKRVESITILAKDARRTETALSIMQKKGVPVTFIPETITKDQEEMIALGMKHLLMD